jgi:hypothetical protein
MRSPLPALAVSLALCASPALAGAADQAFLAKLAGTWTGSGTISGDEQGSVDCKLTLSGTDKVNFRGMCDAGKFGPQDYSGVLTYDEPSKKYLARSNGQTVVGVKSGASVVFTSKMKTMAGTGNSIMKLSTSTIAIDVDLVRSDTGEKLKSHLNFKKT